MNGGDGSSEIVAGDEALAEAGWSTGTVNIVGWWVGEAVSDRE